MFSGVLTGRIDAWQVLFAIKIISTILSSLSHVFKFQGTFSGDEVGRHKC